MESADEIHFQDLCACDRSRRDAGVGCGISDPNHEKTLAALDTEYQAAMLKKDVAAMGRLLPDEFVLLTGKGKTFGKPDTLSEERRGDLVFTHQEDTQQAVGVWGDTAVVTVLLHIAGTD